MKRNIVLGVLIIMLVIISSWNADLIAQCPMCRMSAESNLQHGGSAGKGLNRGILYMLALPYILISTIGFVWWKNRDKESNL